MAKAPTLKIKSLNIKQINVASQQEVIVLWNVIIS